jgi:hypothetical protein
MKSSKQRIRELIQMKEAAEFRSTLFTDGRVAWIRSNVATLEWAIRKLKKVYEKPEEMHTASFSDGID